MITLRAGIWALFAAALLVFSANAFGSVEYTLRKGDTLAKVAKKHHVSVGEIEQANSRLDPRHLRPGTKVTIPVKTSSSSRTTRRPAAKTADSQAPEKHTGGDTRAASKEPEKKAGATYHTVRKGDTVQAIARTYSISPSTLKELNNLKGSRLRPGRKLLVKQIGPRTYTVRKGDNIWRIAKKFDMEASDLMALNEMESPALRVGRKLYLEQPVEDAHAGNYQEAVGANIEEEIRRLAESQDFREQDKQSKLVAFAKKMINIPYRFGGNSILGIDCSAYVKKVYGLLGVELPRTAREQFREGEMVERDELSIGDLVFFRTYASFPSHVGIYLGNNLFIHASSKGKRVTIDSLDTPYYLKRFIGGKRVLTEGEAEAEQQKG